MFLPQHIKKMENFEINSHSKTFSIAPMMDYTDRHFRYFFRLLSKKAILYTEMIPEKTIIYNEKNPKKLDEYLKFNLEEKPLIFQIGGSHLDSIKNSIPIIESYGYDGINLNCGCPSDKTQNGNFGAILMEDPQLVGKIIKVIKENSKLPISIKHRLGIKRKNSDYTDYNFLKRFINICYEQGCNHFIIHARHAILTSLSPEKNRKIPPLIYEWVYRIKEEFPTLKIEINGGISNYSSALQHLPFVDGVMIGRAAYHNSYEFRKIDSFYNKNIEIFSRKEIFKKMYDYIYHQMTQNLHPREVLKHMFGLFYETYGIKKFKNYLIQNIFNLKLETLQNLNKQEFFQILDKSLEFIKEKNS